MRLFPATNIWNTAVDSLPLHTASSQILANIGVTAKLRCDDVMPITYVKGNQPKVPVRANEGSAESDTGLFPIPPDVLVEPGTDGHVLVVDMDNLMLYEMFVSVKQTDEWMCYSSAKWDLSSHALRPYGWTSSDAAGLPIAPGVLQYDEVANGEVTHALRCTTPLTPADVFTWPARHYASRDRSTPNLPQMGQRLRMTASFDVAPFPPRIQTILRGLKKYGVMVADNGMPWGMQHDQDSRWDAAEMLRLHDILGEAMEVVDCSGLCSNSDLGLAVNPPPQAVMVTDKCGRNTPMEFEQFRTMMGSGASLPATPIPAGKLYTYYRTAPGRPWEWKSVVVDGSLALTVDSVGQAHLGVAR